MSDVVSEARLPFIDAEGDAGPADAQVELLEKLIRYSDLIPPGVAARMASAAADDGKGAQPTWPPLAPRHVANRALGCLLGLALGETAMREAAQPGAKRAGQAAAAASRCLAETILSFGGFDEEDFLIRLAGLSADEKAALDPATKSVLDTYEAARTDPAADGAGPDRPDDAAALARLAPIAIAMRDDPDALDVLAVRQTRLSHPGVEAVDASSLFVAILADALTGADLAAATRPGRMTLCPRVLFISEGEWKTKGQEELAQGPGAVATLETALWCVSRSSGTEKAVELAMEFAGSPLAAVLAGLLGGALHGAAAMPAQDPSLERWELGLLVAALVEGANRKVSSSPTA